jgi:putative membrane protein
MELVSLVSRLPLSTVAWGTAFPPVAGLLLAVTIRFFDHKSIASTRRFFGLIFVSTLAWVVPLALGVAVSRLTGLDSGKNEFVLMAFLVWGFESIVINGAFVRNTLASLLLAAVHPIPILLIVVSTGGYTSVWPVLTGLIALAVVLLLLVRLKSLKTKHGVPSLSVLQAFLRTWAGHEPGDLERYFSDYARGEIVLTDVLLTESRGTKVAFILPGVHPGPFYPVGSYNLSELVYRAVQAKGVVPVVLHGTGGHERNTPTNALATAYADEISRFVGSLGASHRGLMRGPLHDKVGITNITTLAFGEHLFALVSNSPFLSDDLDPATTAEASGEASKLGVRLSLVDAHNSVDGEKRPQAQITAADWESILKRVMALPEREFRIGFASSVGMNLKLGRDVSEGGICVTVFATNDAKTALVSADSNNAVSGLRERIAQELAKKGSDLIELCTSDTHNFAARGLTERGYFALGEASGSDAIVDAVKKLYDEAESRIAPSTLAAARFEAETKLIGAESLDDFAGLTKQSTTLAKAYLKVAAPVVLLLIAITLFY